MTATNAINLLIRTRFIGHRYRRHRRFYRRHGAGAGRVIEEGTTVKPFESTNVWTSY